VVSFWVFIFLFLSSILVFVIAVLVTVYWIIEKKEGKKSENTDGTSRPVKDTAWLWVSAVVLVLLTIVSYSIYGKDTDCWLCWPSSKASAPDILAGWVQVMPENGACASMPGENENDASRVPVTCLVKFSVRAVVAHGEVCPSVIVDGDERSRQLKQRSLPIQSNRFDQINVCELPLEENTKSLQFLGGRAIPVKRNWKGGPPKIVFIGDTGCRGMAGKPPQHCRAGQWPFKEIADESADQSPDLVIHLGDYMYGGEDTWEDWNKYFFEPARSLLEAAPWVAVRGNHERRSSENHWRGFYLFFGGASAMTGDKALELAEPYAVDLSPKLRLIVADSAAAFAEKRDAVIESKCGIAPSTGSISINDANVCTAIKEVLSRVGTLEQRKQAGMRVWLATHVPVWAIEKDEKSDNYYVPNSSAMMLGAWRAKPVQNLDFIFSGDRHLYQLVKPKSRLAPIQVAVGTGGVNLDLLPHSGVELEASFIASTNAKLESDKGCSYREHGYLMATQDSSQEKYEFTFHPRSDSYLPDNTICRRDFPQSIAR